MTLAEILVVTSLLALVVGALIPLLTAGQQTWEHATRRQEIVQSTRYALDHFIRDLRAAQTFVAISDTNVRFSYFFGDGTSAPTNEYQFNAATNELENRWDPDPFVPVGGPFRSMSVRCFDAAGVEIVKVAGACPGPTTVRSVEVSLIACEAAPSGLCRPVGDPQTQVPDITVTARAFQQVP